MIRVCVGSSPCLVPLIPERLVLAVVLESDGFHFWTPVRYEPGQLFCKVLGLFVLWG